MKNLKKTLFTAMILACLSVTNAWGDPWENTQLLGTFIDGSSWTAIAPSNSDEWSFSRTVDCSSWSAGTKYFGIQTTDGYGSTFWFANGGTLTVGGTAITLERTDGNNCTFVHDTKYVSYTFTFNYTGDAASSNYNGKWSLSVTGVEGTTTPTVTIAPNGGTFTTTASRSVTLTASNSATVYYTTDGSNPTTSSSSVASGGTISVRPTAAGTTVKAAAADGTGIGTIASATFTYVDPATVTASYFLVGNFFYGESGINYNRRIFKFTEQTDGSYAVDIPATITAYAQILAVDGTTETVYSPGSNYDIKPTWPNTDDQCSGTLAASNAYSWNMTTRNNGTVDDDGIYTVSFTLTNGVPSNWTIKHKHNKRLAFFLSTAPNAIATPMYDNRNNGVNDAFSNRTEGYLHFDPDYSYYLITNVVHANWDSEGILGYAQTIDAGAHQNVNNRSILPTVNKLMLCGNGGFNFQNSNPYNEFSPNEAPMTATGLDKGTYKIQFNPSNGQKDCGQITVNGTQYATNYWSARNSNHKGIRGQVIFLSDGNSDITIKSVSLVGPAFPNSMSGTTWQWTSAAYDMTYDVTEDCYSYTIESQDSELSKFFRFVANHKQKTNWYETNTQAAIPYDGTIANGYSAATTRDPNDVAYTTSGTTSHTDLTNTDNIIWNRPSGQWTIRFYIKHDLVAGESYYYTITGHEYVPVNISGLRTFSYDVALDLPDDESVKAYEAFSYDKNGSTAASDQHGVVSLRRLRYIPANMGVVLKVDGATTTSTAQTVRLLKRNVDNTGLTTANDDYTATTTADYWHAWSNHGETGYTSATPWNNYLVATITRTNLPTNGKIENGEFTERYFALSKYSLCRDYVAGAPDYFGFFRYVNNSYSGANKAYLSLPSSVLDYNGQFIGQTADEPAGALSAQYILFDDDFVTNGIGTVNTDIDNRSADKAWYTLQGVRVSHPTKGIYIHEGKKVIIR